MTKFSTMIGLITVAAVGATPVLAQTVPDSEVPTTSLNIPGNVKLYGDDKPNVYRPSATVNGEIITATDIEQRMALIRIANSNVDLPEDELQDLSSQGFVPVDHEDTARGCPCILARPLRTATPPRDWSFGERRLLDMTNWDVRPLFSMRA